MIFEPSARESLSKKGQARGDTSSVPTLVAEGERIQLTKDKINSIQGNRVQERIGVI
jgi:hypothetical protein